MQLLYNYHFKFSDLHEHKKTQFSLTFLLSYHLISVTFIFLLLGSRIGLIQSVPSSVIYMTIYEKLKCELAQNSNGGFANIIPGLAGKHYNTIYASLTLIFNRMIFTLSLYRHDFYFHLLIWFFHAYLTLHFMQSHGISSFFT